MYLLTVGRNVYFWDVRVVLGTSYSLSGGTVHWIDGILRHPEYNHLNLYNDLAIIHLWVPAVFSNTIAAASIAGPNYQIPDGTTVTHVGWGRLEAGGDASDVLMHVNVNIINQELCASRYAQLKTQPGYEYWPDIIDGMLCAGILNEGGKDACGGGSGGPLLHGPVVVGVTSWRYRCGDDYFPGVNTRVSAYSNWIVANAS